MVITEVNNDEPAKPVIQSKPINPIEAKLFSQRLLQEKSQCDLNDPEQEYKVNFNNVLIQMSASPEAMVRIDLPSFKLDSLKSTIRGRRISVTAKHINMSLSFIVYHQLFMHASGSLILERSETYHMKEFCSNNTTGFALKAYFDTNRNESCEAFEPYESLVSRLNNTKEFFDDNHNVR
jgi:hypothetical protein